MSGVGARRSRHLSLVSGGRVVYLHSRRHECRICGAGWNPLEQGELCPFYPPEEGGAA